MSNFDKRSLGLHSIAITNQKGGVGKTTTSVSLGAALARAGQRVCLIDLDPQANLTMHLGLEPGQAKPGVYELLGGSASLDECVRAVRDNIDLIPAEIGLAGAEVELVGVVGREILLRDALDPARDRYDVLLIDCPPSLGLLTINALSAMEEVLIALQPHFLAMQGLGKLLETVSLVQRRINANLRVSGVVLCMYDSRTALCSEVAEEVKRFFGSEHPLKSLWETAHIFSRYIRRNIRLAEAPGHGKTIFEYAPSSHGAEDYEGLAQELLALWSGTLAEHYAAIAGAQSQSDEVQVVGQDEGTTIPVEAPGPELESERIEPSEPIPAGPGVYGNGEVGEVATDAQTVEAENGWTGIEEAADHVESPDPMVADERPGGVEDSEPITGEQSAQGQERIWCAIRRVQIGIGVIVRVLAGDFCSKSYTQAERAQRLAGIGYAYPFPGLFWADLARFRDGWAGAQDISAFQEDVDTGWTCGLLWGAG